MDRSRASEYTALALRIAREEGAELRVSSAEIDEATLARLSTAFDRGDFVTWRYDEEYARRASDPHTILANARSILCIALPYAHPDKSCDAPLTGRVSSYVGNEDYHDRMRAILSKIARALDEAAGERVTAIACDTTPLAERAFAARAGLGWVGKHTNLISPELGSFVFLGEIVTTLALPADSPLRKTCGVCTRCVVACPTGALRGDYTIDATRCISDLTQRKDGIPREMRPLIGTWVWGCDICQDVCPPNRVTHSRSSQQADRPALLKLLRMRSGEFKREYKESAMGWRGAAVLRRNAAVALGNCRDRSSVVSLVKALNEEVHPMVRGHIAWALGRIGSPAAREALLACAASEADPSVLEEIQYALN